MQMVSADAMEQVLCECGLGRDKARVLVRCATEFDNARKTHEERAIEVAHQEKPWIPMWWWKIMPPEDPDCRVTVL